MTRLSIEADDTGRHTPIRLFVEKAWSFAPAAPRRSLGETARRSLMKA